MADINLSQAEADILIGMEKHRTDDNTLDFPRPGDRLAIALTSPDKRESFVLDVTRTQMTLTKATYQTRVRQAIVLVRLVLALPAIAAAQQPPA